MLKKENTHINGFLDFILGIAKIFFKNFYQLDQNFKENIQACLRVLQNSINQLKFAVTSLEKEFQW